MKYTYFGTVLIACLALVCISPVTALNNFGSGSAFLHQGQAHIFTVTVDSSSQIIMTPPVGTNFDLYAVQCQSFRCSCPTASHVIQFATYSSRNGVSMQESFTLPSGTWCVVVFAQFGSGTYTIYENQNPWIVPMPTGQGQASGMIQFANPSHGMHRQSIPFVNTWDTPFGSTQGTQFGNFGQGQPNRVTLFGNPSQGQASGVLQFGNSGGVIMVTYN